MELTFPKLQNRANLSIQLSLKIAANIPIKIPSIIAINIEENARTTVLGNVSEIILLTNLPDFLKMF